jgi:hypothetical protein
MAAYTIVPEDMCTDVLVTQINLDWQMHKHPDMKSSTTPVSANWLPCRIFPGGDSESIWNYTPTPTIRGETVNSTTQHHDTAAT